jgi:hypothetical protein
MLFQTKINNQNQIGTLNKMEYSQFCDEILKLDKKIRFACVYDGGEFHHKIQGGLTSYLTKQETEQLLVRSVYLWAYRKKVATKIGNPVYSMVKYEKINRVVIPVDKAGLILITTEVDADINKIVDKIIQARNKHYKTD